MPQGELLWPAQLLPPGPQHHQLSCCPLVHTQHHQLSSLPCVGFPLGSLDRPHLKREPGYPGREKSKADGNRQSTRPTQGGREVQEACLIGQTQTTYSGNREEARTCNKAHRPWPVPPGVGLPFSPQDKDRTAPQNDSEGAGNTSREGCKHHNQNITFLRFGL